MDIGEKGGVKPMNNIEILKDLEKYISFANKQCNFSNDADYKWHKELAGMIENLIKENKELKEHLQKCYNGELFTAKQLKNIEENQRKYFIHKSKIKEIIYPTPENYIPLEVQQSEMYKKLEKLVEGK